jgi:amyloid beta precursor protein binding protein 1
MDVKCKHDRKIINIFGWSLSYLISFFRYDRQLRLWGDHGQVALEKARVCMIGATATATEILKSLVLPGVGSFTIIDGKKVTQEDIGNNFFLENECVNQSRGSVATR